MFGLWAKMIKISINENFIEGDNGIEWNPTSAANIFLGYDKAMQLLHLLKIYRDDMTRDMTENVVESGKSIIAVYNGSYFNKSSDITVIRVIQFTDDSKTNIAKQAAYQLNTGFGYGTIDENTMKVTYSGNNKYSEKELDMIIIQIQTYVEAMANSYAYANSENTSSRSTIGFWLVFSKIIAASINLSAKIIERVSPREADPSASRLLNINIKSSL